PAPPLAPAPPLSPAPPLAPAPPPAPAPPVQMGSTPSQSPSIPSPHASWSAPGYTEARVSSQSSGPVMVVYPWGAKHATTIWARSPRPPPSAAPYHSLAPRAWGPSMRPSQSLSQRSQDSAAVGCISARLSLQSPAAGL